MKVRFVWLFIPLFTFSFTTVVYAEGVIASEDIYVHPLCLDPLLDMQSEAVPKKIVCSAKLKKIPVEQFEWRERTRYVSERPGVEEWSEGTISYSVARRWMTGNLDEVAVLEVASNTGGSGSFSSIWLVKKQKGSDVIEPLIQMVGGDRCNGGGLRFIDINNAGITYTNQATPHMLLNPFGTVDWRRLITLKTLKSIKGEPVTGLMPKTLNGWEPYEDVANSAISCAGGIVKHFDFSKDITTVLGVRIDRGDFLAERQGKVQFCINHWLEQSEHSSDPTELNEWIDLNTWVRALDQLSEYCAD